MVLLDSKNWLLSMLVDNLKVISSIAVVLFIVISLGDSLVWLLLQRDKYRFLQCQDVSVENRVNTKVYYKWSGYGHRACVPKFSRLKFPILRQGILKQSHQKYGVNDSEALMLPLPMRNYELTVRVKANH